MKFFPMFFVLAAFLLSACSSTPTNYKGIYEGTKEIDPLQIPPDLSQPDYEGDSLATITSYLGYEKSLKVQDNGEMLNAYHGMLFRRDGTEFWLDVNDTPIHVWQSLRGFFGQLGFKIIYEKPELGLMQTNWQENYYSPATNWFLKFVGKLASTEIMDGYRAHLEYDSAKKTTRVFIAHQGVREENVDGENGTLTVEWVRRPPDTELEVEMLMRFMEYRGVDKKQAKQAVAQAKVVEKAVLKQTADGYVLQYNSSFPRVWRLVGIALDRMGILVEDRNYSAGVFYIKLSDSFKLDGKTGFFESSITPSKDTYLITLEDKGDTTLIMVKARGKAGPDLPAVAKKILTDIKINLH